MPVHIAARQGHMHMLSFILELCPGAARYNLGFIIIFNFILERNTVDKIVIFIYD